MRIPISIVPDPVVLHPSNATIESVTQYKGTMRARFQYKPDRGPTRKILFRLPPTLQGRAVAISSGTYNIRLDVNDWFRFLPQSECLQKELEPYLHPTVTGSISKYLKPR